MKYGSLVSRVRTDRSMENFHSEMLFTDFTMNFQIHFAKMIRKNIFLILNLLLGKQKTLETNLSNLIYIWEARAENTECRCDLIRDDPIDLSHLHANYHITNLIDFAILLLCLAVAVSFTVARKISDIKMQ